MPPCVSTGPDRHQSSTPPSSLGSIAPRRRAATPALDAGDEHLLHIGGGEPEEKTFEHRLPCMTVPNSILPMRKNWSQAEYVTLILRHGILATFGAAVVMKEATECTNRAAD
jgi:hypothetical protein